MQLTDALANTLGKGLSAQEIELLARMASERLVLGGEVLVRQFERNSDIHLVLSGSLRIYAGSDELVAEVGEGSVIGEVALVDDGPRSATVRSNGESRVAVLPADQLRQLCEDNERIGFVLMRNVAKVLASRIRGANLHLK